MPGEVRVLEYGGVALGMELIPLVISPAAVATIVAVEQTFTVPAQVVLPALSYVGITKPTINGAISPCMGRRASSTTIGITFVNPTAGSVTPTASEVYQILLVGPSA